MRYRAREVDAAHVPLGDTYVPNSGIDSTVRAALLVLSDMCAHACNIHTNEGEGFFFLKLVQNLKYNEPFTRYEVRNMPLSKLTCPPS